jgi:transcription-repair coupling factor (superfamily II helicase)
MYKRIANASSSKELKELQIEMIDRFGLLPDQVKNLFQITELKLRAEAMNIVKIDAGVENGRIEFAADAKVDPLTLVKMVQNQPQKYKLEGADKLRFSLNMEKTDARFNAIESLLSDLAVKTS